MAGILMVIILTHERHLITSMIARIIGYYGQFYKDKARCFTRSYYHMYTMVFEIRKQGYCSYYYLFSFAASDGVYVLSLSKHQRGRASPLQ